MCVWAGYRKCPCNNYMHTIRPFHRVYTVPTHTHTHKITHILMRRTYSIKGAYFFIYSAICAILAYFPISNLLSCAYESVCGSRSMHTIYVLAGGFLIMQFCRLDYCALFCKKQLVCHQHSCLCTRTCTIRPEVLAYGIFTLLFYPFERCTRPVICKPISVIALVQVV